MNEHLVTLAKYPEFYALKEELLKYCNEITDELSELNVASMTFELEAGVKIETVKKVKGLLTRLGMVTAQDITKKRKTYE